MTTSSGRQQDLLVAILKQVGEIPDDHETFTLDVGDAILVYDVTKAKEIVADGRPADQRVDTFLQLMDIHPDTITTSKPGIEVNIEWAATRSLDEPAILVFLPERWGSPWGIMIDGWHRTWKAAHMGTRYLPAVAILPDEEPAIRIAPDAEYLDRLAERHREQIEELNRLSWGVGAPRFPERGGVA